MNGINNYERHSVFLQSFLKVPILEWNSTALANILSEPVNLLQFLGATTFEMVVISQASTKIDYLK